MYLYDNMDTTTKFNETELPPKEEFYSKLNDSDISHEDYKNVKKVWKEFKMKTMGDYHDLYLKTDVLLPAKMFEESRNGCHKLDPAWYFPAPGLAWDATLKETAVELESLTDSDMLLMTEKGNRGGISMISNRFARVNKKYLGEAHD